MPNPATHIEMAYGAAQLFDSVVIHGKMSQYLLGSTAPDIRVITGRGRELYHFAPLDFDEVGAGEVGLFERHPELAKMNHRPTAAFIAGYVSHLILDEMWITTMYRPYFGVDGIFETVTHGAVMDRAMQLELDSIAYEDFDGLLADLTEFDGGVDVPFIDTETLAQWHQWVKDFVSQRFAWDRLRFMARRIAKGNESHSVHRIADEFVQGMPGTLDGLHEVVPKQKLKEFKRDAMAEMARSVERYLE